MARVKIYHERQNRKETKMQCNLAVIKGDGIGPEVVTEAMKVLDTVGEKFGHTFDYEQILMGGCSIDATGVPLTDEAVAVAKSRMRFFSVQSEEIHPHHHGISSLQIFARRQDF